MASSTVLPQRRDLTVADLAAVVDLLTASDMAVLGHTDFAVEEIEADLRRDDLEAHGWYDRDALVGYGWVSRVESTERVEVDAYVRPGHDTRLGTDILSFLEERGLALAAEAGHVTALFDLGAYRQDEVSRSWLADRGFTTATSFVRMRIDLDGPGAVPDPPPGLVIRRLVRDDEDGVRVAYDVHEAAFTEHFGHVPTSFASFRARLTEKGDGWSEVWLAEIDGDAVGMLVGTRQFVEDENAGYVRLLGTLPAARGRGVGKALLRAYFDVSARAGRVAVLLHVDVANVTDALRVYESVGMRPVLTIDAWTKRAPTRCADTPL